MLTEKAVIAKSNIILDVKPWDDETDMAEIERLVRSIEADGLLWGSCKKQFVLLKKTLINVAVIEERLLIFDF